MQITLGTQYNMSGRNHLKKNQNTPRPSEHPRCSSERLNDLITVSSTWELTPVGTRYS